MELDFDTMFPDVREQGETPLRQSQLVMLRMLKIMDYLCIRHRITYFLTGGTLLGAVRHKGFIPWDDDMDIGMTRANYEKFVKFAVPELPYDIFFQTPQTDIHFPACGRVEAKLKDKYSTYIQPEDKQHQKHHLGLQLDLFVYDRAYLPHNRFLYLLNRGLEICFWKVGPNNKGNEKRAAVLKKIARFSPVPLVWASSFVISKKMIKLGQCYKTNSEIATLVRLPFEDMEALAPAGWKTYLTRMYGNYMKMPPLNKQQGHHGAALPQPFTPCAHTEVLVWADRKNKKHAV